MHGDIPQKAYGGEGRLRFSTNIPTTVPDPPVVESSPVECHAPTTHSLDYSGNNIFTLTPHDNNQGLSTEDRAFLQEMTKEFKKNAVGNGGGGGPLPFRSQRPRLPGS